jgi:hypothetical protein
MVVPVVRGPPQDAFLRRRLGAEGQDELEQPAHLEAAVGEIPVIAGRDEEDPPEERDRQQDQRGRETPVKNASRDTAWTRRKLIDETQFTRSSRCLTDVDRSVVIMALEPTYR